jgi:Transglycosylase-like domain
MNRRLLVGLLLGLFLALLVVVVRASAETPREQRLRLENRRLRYRLSDYGRWVRALQAVIRRPSIERSHWLERAFTCIYRYERGRGGWSTQTGNGYYGGLQMDLSFQRAYGREYLRLGTADRWPASVQIAVGIAGWLERGFQPWPQTRRACGL